MISAGYTCTEHDFYYYVKDASGHATSCNENGWRCCSCGFAPGEPAGFDPKLDRELISVKVDGMLHDLHEAGFVYVSNNTMGDGIVASVVARCRREDRFDAYSIAHAILDALVESHADYWRKVSNGILAGSDPRDRCPCGALSTSSRLWRGKWIRRCGQHTSADFRGDYGGPGAGPQRDLFQRLDETLATDGWPEDSDAPF